MFSAMETDSSRGFLNAQTNADVSLDPIELRERGRIRGVESGWVYLHCRIQITAELEERGHLVEGIPKIFAAELDFDMGSRPTRLKKADTPVSLSKGLTMNSLAEVQKPAGKSREVTKIDQAAAPGHALTRSSGSSALSNTISPR